MTSQEKKVLSFIDEAEVVAFMQDLIRARSDYPPGDSREIAALCRDKMAECGMQTTVVTPPDTVTSPFKDGLCNIVKPSVIGKIYGTGDGPTLMLSAHMDTVPAGDVERWTHPPFEGVNDHGVIYGRGAGDCKGSVCIQVMAAVAIKRAGIQLKGDLLVNPIADEEASGHRGANFLRDYGIVKPDLIIIGEQTENEVAVAERSIMYCNVTIKGKAVHGALPWRGVNATVLMSDFIQAVKDEVIPEVERVEHPYLPKTSISMTKITGGIQTNIIPELCTLSIDTRMVPGVTEEFILGRFKEILQRLSDRGPHFEWWIDITNTDNGISVNTDPKHPMIQHMLAATSEIKGKDAQPTGYYQHSDGSRFARLGVPIAIFGPTDPGLGHATDERVTVEELMEGTKILALSILRILGQEEGR